jgi:hypothetical protein
MDALPVPCRPHPSCRKHPERTAQENPRGCGACAGPTHATGWRMGMAALFGQSRRTSGRIVPQAAPVLRMKLSRAASSSPSTPPALPFATGFIALSADMARFPMPPSRSRRDQFARRPSGSALIGPARQRAVDCRRGGVVRGRDDPRGERAVVQVVLNPSVTPPSPRRSRRGVPGCRTVQCAPVHLCL